MAKRFINSEIFKDPWFSNLPLKFKMFYIYILNDCSHSGIWMVNFKIACCHIGEHLEPSEVERYFSGKVVKFSQDRWFIPRFISFQYGDNLNPAHRVHKGIYAELKKYDLLRYINKHSEENVENDIKNKENELVCEGSDNSIDTVKEKDTDTDKEKEMDKEKEKECEEEDDTLFEGSDSGGDAGSSGSAAVKQRVSRHAKRKGKREKADAVRHELQLWVDTNAPKVNKLKHPLTAGECRRLCEEFEEDVLKEVLLEMENYRKLLPSYESANLTLRKWLKLRREPQMYRTKTVKPDTGTPFKYWQPGMD